MTVPPFVLVERPGRAVSLLSTALLFAMHAALLLVFFVPFSWALVGLAALSYALRMWAITVGYHRYFSHRAFRTSRGFQFILGLLGTTAMQNGSLWWASWHRRHHKYSDTTKDRRCATRWRRALYGTGARFGQHGGHTDWPEMAVTGVVSVRRADPRRRG